MTSHILDSFPHTCLTTTSAGCVRCAIEIDMEKARKYIECGYPLVSMSAMGFGLSAAPPEQLASHNQPLPKLIENRHDRRKRESLARRLNKRQLNRKRKKRNRWK